MSPGGNFLGDGPSDAEIGKHFSFLRLNAPTSGNYTTYPKIRESYAILRSNTQHDEQVTHRVGAILC